MFSRLVYRYWLLVPLLIVAIVIVDRVEEPTVFEVEETIDMRATRSDYYMSDFTSRKFGPEGQIEFVVQGATLAHYPDDDRSEIERPRIELRRQDTTWHIESQSGRFDTDPDLFTLEGDVIVKRRSSSNREPVIIKTSGLEVATSSNEVKTDKPIEILSESWTLRAIGMKSAIDDGRLTLLSEVIGRYEIPDAR